MTTVRITYPRPVIVHLNDGTQIEASIKTDDLFELPQMSSFGNNLSNVARIYAGVASRSDTIWTDFYSLKGKPYKKYYGAGKPDGDSLKGLQESIDSGESPVLEDALHDSDITRRKFKSFEAVREVENWRKTEADQKADEELKNRILIELQRYVLIDNIVLEKIEHEPTLVVTENNETGECDIWIDHTLMHDGQRFNLSEARKAGAFALEKANRNKQSIKRLNSLKKQIKVLESRVECYSPAYLIEPTSGLDIEVPKSPLEQAISSFSSINYSL